MSKAFDFFVWIIVGGLFCLFLAYRDMWRSRTGRDIVSETKKELENERKK